MHARFENFAYDYRITIVIRGYEICIENEIKEMNCLLRTWLRDGWACLLGIKVCNITNQLAPFGSLQRLRALIVSRIYF